jgi:hypothetical protein
MSMKLNRKAMALTASLALAAAATFSTAASAQKFQRDPVCDQRVADECVTTWQAGGYSNYDHCVGHQQCMQCPPIPGYLCGIGPGDYYAAEPASGTRPW